MAKTLILTRTTEGELFFTVVPGNCSQLHTTAEDEETNISSEILNLLYDPQNNWERRYPKTDVDSLSSQEFTDVLKNHLADPENVIISTSLFY